MMPLTQCDNFTHVDLSYVIAVTLKGIPEVEYSLTTKVSYCLELHLRGGGVVRTGTNDDKDDMMQQMKELLTFLENKEDAPND
jgi:hypothetical protein